MIKVTFILTLVFIQGIFTQDPCGSISDGYQQVMCKSFVFYEAQRSGFLPDTLRIDWRWDSATNDGSDFGVDLEGGYYDAGDYVKFMLPQAYSLTALSWGLILYQSSFDTAGQTQYARDAIRWGTDFLLKCYVSDNQIFGQVGDGHVDHAYWGRPEEMTMARPSFHLSTTAPGSDLTGEYAAALAAASIVFTGVDDTYAAQCLNASRNLFNFANTYRGNYGDSIPNAADFYRSYEYADELAWAALWLYKATGEQTYLDLGLALVEEGGIHYYADYMGWDSKNPGVWALLAELDPNGQHYGLLAEYAYRMINEKTKTPGGVLYFDQWGSLRNAANAAFIVLRAGTLLGYDTGNTDTNIQFAKGQLDYMLGSNPLGRSFVVGYGTNPPTQPHHRSSSCPDMPEVCDWTHEGINAPNPQSLYGALVGGVDANDGYEDIRTDYVQNEVTLDYNALFTGLVAGIIQYG